MDYGQHCRLCENRVYNIETGTRCSITNEKPIFEKKCDDILFDIKLKNLIDEVNIEIEKIAQSKSLTYVNFGFYLALGVIVILAGYIYGKMVYESGWISTIPLIIMFAGFGVLPLAFGPFNKYRQGLKIAYQKKVDLDSILSLYGVTYEIKIITHKDVHGNKEFETDISFKK